MLIEATGHVLALVYKPDSVCEDAVFIPAELVAGITAESTVGNCFAGTESASTIVICFLILADRLSGDDIIPKIIKEHNVKIRTI